MSTSNFGSDDLQLPDELREPLLKHLADLRQRYIARDWAGRVGFGERPALIVIDLALYWTQPRSQIGTNADSVVDASIRVLNAARDAGIPIFFTSFAYDPADPPSPQNRKLKMNLKPGDERFFELDPRLDRRQTEKLIRKRYASAFKGTNLHEMLTSLGVDTLIVTGLSTSHCCLRNLSRRDGQLPRHRSQGSCRRALRGDARGQPARYRHRSG